MLEQHKTIETEKEVNFIFPDITSERGEIERVAKRFFPQNRDIFVERFVTKANESGLTPLTEDVWVGLQNTESFQLTPNDWDKIDAIVLHENEVTHAQRDWRAIKERMENGGEIDAPIVLSMNDGTTHLVSGNTRLMVARALGIEPQVLLVEI